MCISFHDTYWVARNTCLYQRSLSWLGYDWFESTQLIMSARLWWLWKYKTTKAFSQNAGNFYVSNGCSKESGRLGFTLTSFSQAKWPKMASEAIYPPSCCMLMATGLWPHHLQKEPSYLFGPSRFAVRQKIFGEKQTEMQSLWSISSHIEALQPDSAKTPTLHSCQILFTIESSILISWEILLQGQECSPVNCTVCTLLLWMN